VTKKYTFIVIKKIHCWAMVICFQYWSKTLAATNLNITVKWPVVVHVRTHSHGHICLGCSHFSLLCIRR